MTRYELVERIGAGGMAEIFRGQAIAAGGFEKPVAIKRILPHLSSDKRFVELLIAEAHILSHLRHRNIVQIFDVGLGPDGQYFLVMEFVDGADLGRIRESMEAARKKLPVELGLYIGSEVCDALEQAHTAPGPDGMPMRLVHRDVSPSNVLLSRSGEVKLTDFGIAKRPEEVTGHGTVRGKFAYISPEQAVNGHVDARSDVFSAGIVLYELLLGRRLFSQMPDFDALRAVRTVDVPRPLEVAPDIDPRLDRLLLKAMAKNPDDRFDTAGELGSALREIMYSLPAGDGDPAQELAGLVERYTKPRSAGARDSNSFEEATVVRIQSRHGFSLTMDAVDVEEDRLSYIDARQIVSSFEEEVTRAIANPGLLGAHFEDDLDDDLDDDRGPSSDLERDIANLPDAVGSRRVQQDVEEATVVGHLGSRRKRPAQNDDRPTTAMPSPSELSGLRRLVDVEDGGEVDGQRQHAASSGEIGGGRSDTGGGDIPTLDRGLANAPASSPGLPVSASGMPASSSGGPAAVVMGPGQGPTSGPIAGPAAMGVHAGAANSYPGMYSHAALEAAARRRRKRVILGVGIGSAILLSLVIVALAMDDGEPPTGETPEIDAAVTAPIDAGVPIDAVPVDAAPPKQKTKKKTKKKRTRKKTKKKTTGKKTTGKKTTGKKTTGKKTTGKKTTGKKTTGKKTTGKNTRR